MLVPRCTMRPSEMNNIIVECAVRSRASQVSLMDDPVVELIKG